MKSLIIIFIIFINILLFPQNIARDYPLQKAYLGNFITFNNDTIKNCFTTYRIFGTMNKDSSNIIFFPTWLAGNSEHIGVLLSKYSFIDTNKFCIISIDALGNGYSASPSNTEIFPQITFNDITEAYYKTLTQHLKISKLYAIVGGSMGGMTAFHFAVKYPDFAKRIISYVSSPKLSSFDLLWINLQINLVEYLLSLNIPNKDIKAFSDMITALISRTPAHLNKSVPTSDFYEYFKKFYKEPDSIYTLKNYLTQLKAIITYDITSDFNYDMKKATDEIKAQLFIIVSDSDMMVNPDNAIEFANLSKSKLLVLNNNCGHMAVNCEMEKVKDTINNFLTSD